MVANRKSYAQTLTTVLESQLQLISNEKNPKDIYEHFLGVDSETVQDLINKITTGLPEVIMEVDPKLARQIQTDIVDNFILFMVQESTSTSDSFGQTFSEFIQYLVEDLVNNNLGYFRGKYDIH